MTTLLACLASTVTAMPVRAAARATVGSDRASTALANLASRTPVAFEANRGQTDGHVTFLARSADSTLALGRDRLTISVVKTAQDSVATTDATPRSRAISHPPHVVARGEVSLVFLGANPTAAIIGREELPGKANYFLGNDSSKWQTDIPTYARVEYQDVYPGIDLVFYGTPDGEIEHDWIVHPGADFRRIQLRVEGAEHTTVSRTGELVLGTPAGDVTQTPPRVYEQNRTGRHPLSGGYQLGSGGVVSYTVGAHDPLATVVIDPALVFSTYVGGTRVAVAVDTQRNVYVVGQAPITFAISVLKFDPSGHTLLYSTTFGGTVFPSAAMDLGYGIAVDATGAAYVTGVAGSCDFPTLNQIPGSVLTCVHSNGQVDLHGFVTKLAASNGSLVYSSVIGGSWWSQFFAVAVDAAGRAYITGQTASPDFPTVNAFQSTFTGNPADAGDPALRSWDTVVCAISASGSTFEFSTFLGGSQSADGGAGIATDATGGVYVTGYTADGSFPTTLGAVQPISFGNGGDAFVTKFNTGGATLAYSTYLGGDDSADWGAAIAVDSAGEAFVTGTTSSRIFPTTPGAFQNTNRGSGSDGHSLYDAFVTKLDADGSAFGYSSYLGGRWNDRGTSIAVDATGRAFVAGFTNSDDLPTVNAIEPGFAGPQPAVSAVVGDGFIAELDATGTPDYLTYLGGWMSDGAYGIAVDDGDSAYVTGATASPNFPVVDAYQPVYPVTATGLGFLAKIQRAGDQVYPIGGPPISEQSWRNFCLSCWEQMVMSGQLAADPVDTEFGSLMESATDISIPARGTPLAFLRSYNSTFAATAGPLGYGWTFNAASSLSQDPTTGKVTISQENGSQVTFVQQGSAYVPSAPRFTATLSHDGTTGNFTLVRHARDRLVFSSAGKLLSESDLNGDTTTYTYTAGQLTAIMDSSGARSLSLGYTSNLLTGVTDPIGRVVHFAYNDGAGNLTDVTDVNGGVTHYTYDAAHHLVTMTDPRGGAVTNTWTGGQVTRQVMTVVAGDHSQDRTTTFAYSGDPTSATGGTTTVTDPKGNVTIEAYQYGVRTALTHGVGTPQAATWTYTYDPATLTLIATTDPNGHLTRHSYDSSGNMVSSSDGLGHAEYRSYDSINDVTTSTDGAGVTTTMTYGGGGNLLSRSTPITSIISQTTSYTYGDPAHPGDVTAMTDPDSQQWAYTYDQYGDRTSVTDPLGDKTTTQYNTVGWTTATVSARGNVAGCNCASQYTTTFSYADPSTGLTDNFGDVRTVTDPLGHTSTRGYDADRNLVRATDGNGHTTSYQFNLVNELTDTFRADDTTLHTDYFPDGSVRDQVDGAGNVTSFAYDALGRQTSMTTPATATCPTGCTTSSTYDGAGNRLTVVDPQQQTTTYSYDAANEVTSISYSDNVTPNVTTIVYDADGRRTSMTDGTGTSLWSYDQLGRLVVSQSGSGSKVLYGYDRRGSMTSITYPLNRQVWRTFDNAGRLTAVQDWQSNTTHFTVDPDGDITAVRYPNGVTANRIYDAAGRVTSVTDAPATGPALASFAYGRDGLGQVTSEADTGSLTANNTYGYTVLNQFGSVNTAPYAYDGADNLTQSAAGTSQGYDAAGQVTLTRSPISLVGAASGTGSAGGGVVSIAVPAGLAASDQIIVATTSALGTAATAPAGFVPVGTVSSGTTSGAQTSVWRRTASGQETTVAVPYGGLSPVAVVVAVYRGVDPTTPVDVQSSGSSTGSTTVTAPSVTTSLPWERLLMVDGATGNASPAAWTPPSGMTAQTSASTLALVSSSLADQRQPAAGATGARTVTFGTSAQLTAMLIALKPGTAATYAFDPRGNRTATTPGTGSTASPVTLTYDQANRLTRYTADGTSAPSYAYAYDGDGLRMSKGLRTGTGTAGALTTTDWYVWDRAEGTPLLLADGSNSYVYGPLGPIEQVSSTGTITYLHQDQLGSTRLVTDQSGGVVGTSTYDPYGNLATSTGSVTSPLLYAGQYRDAESGFYYLRARYYDPATGQFLSRDPLELLSKQAYGYADDDPLNKTDPTGKLFGLDTVLGAVIGGVVGTVTGAGGYLLGVATGHDDFSWQRLAGATTGGLIGGALAGACTGTAWVAAATCGAAGGAVGAAITDAIDGHAPTPTDLIEGALFGGAGGVAGAKAFELRGFRPRNLSNVWDPGINALRLYGQGVVSGSIGLSQGLIDPMTASAQAVAGCW